jgi:transcriptional regulator with XRE-family HTH domain
MQALSLATLYAVAMPSTSPQALSRLKTLREKAGISQRELARLLGVHHSNVSFWERSGVPPRSEVLPKIAQVLGVSVDEVLGQSSKSRASVPVARGKLGQIFNEVAKLPRRKQQHIIAMLDDMVTAHKARAS